MLIAVEDPTSPDVLALLEEHLADMFATSPPESVHALDPEALRHPSITFWAARDADGALLGVGALKQHDAALGELKSMRTSRAARGRGVASAVLGAVIAEARARGLRELALETGVEDYFAPARALYARHGFVRRDPFAAYTDDPNSVYLTLDLAPGPFAALRAEIAAHPDNAAMTAAGWSPLFTGSPTSRILVIGQAPGRKAQEAGVPWRDASGARLTGWLGVDDALFHDPAAFAIVPMDFYYPGKGTTGDLPPRPGFAEQWHPRLLAELGQVRLTVLVGAYAQRHHLAGRARASLTETVRAWRDYLPAVPVVHPSPLNFRWQARNPWFEAELVPELRTLVAQALA